MFTIFIVFNDSCTETKSNSELPPLIIISVNLEPGLAYSSIYIFIMEITENGKKIMGQKLTISFKLICDLSIIS